MEIKLEVTDFIITIPVTMTYLRQSAMLINVSI